MSSVEVRLAPATFGEGIYLGPVLRVSKREEVVFFGHKVPGTTPSKDDERTTWSVLLHGCGALRTSDDDGRFRRATHS